jgi:predicted RNase H-like nuclease (RuvC/YqgF family)
MEQRTETINAQYQRRHKAGLKTLLLEMKHEIGVLREQVDIIATSVCSDRLAERQREQHQRENARLGKQPSA